MASKSFDLGIGEVILVQICDFLEEFQPLFYTAISPDPRLLTLALAPS